tara:strand:- start:1081 stop:1233 length:153 start_codon:yes stop_codon:yes gene_type:complete
MKQVLLNKQNFLLSEKLGSEALIFFLMRHKIVCFLVNKFIFKLLVFKEKN